MLRLFYAFFRREFTYIWRDRGLRVVLLVMPLLSLLLFGLTYRTQVLTDIPTAIADLDHSAQSRAVASDIKQAENLDVVAYYNSYEEIKRAIEKGEVVVGVVIPEKFGQQQELRRPTRVAMIIDGSNMVYAINSSVAVLQVVRTIEVKSGVKVLLAQGEHMQDAKNALMAVNFVDEPWFNPTINYAFFLVLGLVLNIWQQCCTLLSAMTIIGETGTRSWVHLKSSSIPLFIVFLAKILAHLVIFMATVAVLYGLCFEVLHLPLRCDFGKLMLFTLGFAVAMHSLGTLISSFARNSADASRIVMAIAVPAFVLSGFTWPLEAMPQVLAQVVKWLPQTGFFQGVIFLTMKDASWTYMSQYYFQFLLFALIAYALSMVFFRLIPQNTR
ncbi:MAG: ABC transporter permease [Syntrophomonas sp.]|uniref:ABC transporter permease n=1 Tax=Syntrophomonas sp. TaxID=2053627 RepID=UPI00262151DA|nr:ABC transporter permease [Syntrophomonas sp.]MDD4626535.1 ABC transporter permease [Syntrophomonas sp.]